MSVISRTLESCEVAVRTAFDALVIQPLRGLQEFLAGVALAGPELARAVSSAAVQAVQQHLSPDGQVRVQEGGAMILGGAKRLVTLAAVATGLWICWSAGILYLASAWLVLAMCLSAG